MNHILFKGARIEEFNRPKIKKVTDKIIDQILILSPFKSGYKEMIRKNKKNTIPKFLFELIFILVFFKIKLMKVVSSYPLY